MNDLLNIAIATDSNYLKYAATSVISVFENNKNFGQIVIHVLYKDLTIEDIDLFKSIGNNYEYREIIFYDMNNIVEYIGQNVSDRISIMSYARLFLSSILPHNVEKIIYMDVDSLILKSLKDLWYIDMGENFVAAVLDMVNEKHKLEIGLNSNSPYFNAGFLFIDLEKWRSFNILDKFIKYLKLHNGDVSHNDQGVMNSVLKGEILKLPVNYNLTTTFFELSVAQIKKLYAIGNEYYSQEEVDEAKENPIFVHFTPSYSKRPWNVNCQHPLLDLYLDYYSKNPFGSELINDKRSTKAKFANVLFKILPFPAYAFIFNSLNKIR